MYEAKNVMRDMTGLLRIIFGTTFSDASDLWGKQRGMSDVAKLAERTLGPGSRLTRLFIDYDDWIGEVIRRRNALEHPGGRSGTLVIKNYLVSGNGRLQEPIWQFAGEEPSNLIVDLMNFYDGLLVLAEEASPLRRGQARLAHAPDR